MFFIKVLGMTVHEKSPKSLSKKTLSVLTNYDKKIPVVITIVV